MNANAGTIIFPTNPSQNVLHAQKLLRGVYRVLLKQNVLHVILYASTAILPVIAPQIGEFAKKTNTFPFKRTVVNVNPNILTIQEHAKVV